MTFRLEMTEMVSLNVLLTSRTSYPGSFFGSSQKVTPTIEKGHIISNAIHTIYCNRMNSIGAPPRVGRGIW